MAGYTKLFSSIIASTIWRAGDKTRLVWITMLAMADQFGVVEASVPGLSDMARVTVDECREALDELQQPDPDSRSSDQEGRRIEAVDGGWRLINHGKYRDKMSRDERREYQRLYQRNYRKQNVNSDSDKLTKFDIQNRTEAEQKQKKDVPAPPVPPTPQPLIARRRRDAAFEGQRGLYVTSRQHSDFIALGKSEADLIHWYAEVCDEWSEGPKRESEPGADMFAFWRDRYKERWPATKTMSKAERVGAEFLRRHGA